MNINERVGKLLGWIHLGTEISGGLLRAWERNLDVIKVVKFLIGGTNIAISRTFLPGLVSLSLNFAIGIKNR
jgi:hypothetical protein